MLNVITPEALAQLILGRQYNDTLHLDDRPFIGDGQTLPVAYQSDVEQQLTEIDAGDVFGMLSAMDFGQLVCMPVVRNDVYTRDIFYERVVDGFELIEDLEN
jgi:hypothetical protein